MTRTVLTLAAGIGVGAAVSFAADHDRHKAVRVTQLAREFGGYVIGTGRAADRQKALDFGAQEFLDLDNDTLEDAGEVDLVFDVIGGGIAERSAGLIRAGGTLVSITGPTERRRSTSAPGSSSTSRTTRWQTSAKSIWSSMSSAATSRRAPRP